MNFQRINLLMENKISGVAGDKRGFRGEPN